MSTTDFKKFKRYFISEDNKDNPPLLSHWTNANTVEFDDGTILQSLLGEDGLLSNGEKVLTASGGTLNEDSTITFVTTQDLWNSIIMLSADGGKSALSPAYLEFTSRDDAAYNKIFQNNIELHNGETDPIDVRRTVIKPGAIDLTNENSGAYGVMTTTDLRTSCIYGMSGSNTDSIDIYGSVYQNGSMEVYGDLSANGDYLNVSGTVMTKAISTSYGDINIDAGANGKVYIDGTAIKVMTQDAYDALTTKDENTLYFIKE